MGPTILILVGVVSLIFIFLVALAASFYHRVPPSEVMVVYGRKTPRLVTNGGVFVMPIVESYKKLDMTIMTIKTEKDEVYTVTGIPIKLDWVAQVQIDPQEPALRTAARAFLDKSRDEVRQVIVETLSANFRAIVGQMTVEAIHRDRDDFVQKVQDLASDDVAAMGVRVISMGIEEITDDEGYLEAMAAPEIAAIKRDATIAQAEAEREARVKAAAARQYAEQAEFDAQREILSQRQNFELREVEVHRQVELANAAKDQEVQKQRALAVEQQQEAEVLVPARASREATEIKAEAERRRMTITAEAEATATRTTALANAEATEKTGRAEAAALQAMKEAEAEGMKASLLAEAEGRRELAAASAAEDEINLRQFIVEMAFNADVKKAEAISEALAGLGGNVRIVQLGNGHNGSGMTGNTFMDMLMNIPEVAEVLRAKVEALSGDDMQVTIGRIANMIQSLQGMKLTNNGDEQPAQVEVDDVTAAPDTEIIEAETVEDDT